jgi:glycosyltransferase involved in cell wall biosynthesis
MNKVLLVAFHFPPLSGGSGVHRASALARYLPENGWQPHVLTVTSCAHQKVDLKHQLVLPAGVSVQRAFAFDARRHFAFRGRYCEWLALPDAWANWALTAIPAGLLAIYRKDIDLILVTFPIATAVFIGLALQILTGKPLVVDFRDSMTEPDYPRRRRTRRIWQWIERSVVEHGTQFIFTTESARRMYLERYPSLLPIDCVVIPNGYDEEDFAGVSIDRNTSLPGRGQLRLLHAGLIYPEERDPAAFFRAVQNLKLAGKINAAALRIHLRASGSEHYFAPLLQKSGIDDLVHLLPALPHHEALQEMAKADGLLIFQAASCNHQIPAKVYEYLKLGKPILALTSTEGDTAALLNDVGGATIADLSDEVSITNALSGFLTKVRNGIHPLPDRDKTRRFSRRHQTARLARHLDELLYSRLIPQQDVLRQ